MATTTPTRAKQRRVKPDDHDTAPGSGQERITVALLSRVARDLAKVVRLTGLTKTDAVNRSISLYAFAQEEFDKGNELAIYDPKADAFTRVRMI